MKHTFSLMVAAIIVATAVSCGDKFKSAPVPFEDVTITQFDSISVDGYSIRGTTSDVLKMVTSANDTLSFDLTPIKESKKLYGNVAPGDEVYVMLSSADSVTATMVINKSALLGRWVQPDPIDGSDETGIEIKTGGDARSIAQAYVEYKSWRVFNGKLVIVEMRDDGMDEEARLYTILKVTPDSLILRADDDPEAPFEFGRWKENHEYDDLPTDLILDDGEDDMFRF